MYEARIRHSDVGLYYVDIFKNGKPIQTRAWYGFTFWFARLAARRILRRYNRNRWVVR